MTESVGKFLLRLAPMIYGPTLLFATGEGIIIPLIPSMAAHLGADLAMSGLVASAIVVGQLSGSLPASWFVARVGERIAMVTAGFIALAGAVLMLIAPNIALLAVSIFVIGMSGAAFGLARHSFMTSRVPFQFRARALSLLGGSFRLGMFVGPFLGALLIWLTSSQQSAVWGLVGCLIVCVALVWFGPDPEREPIAKTTSSGEAHSATARGDKAGGDHEPQIHAREPRTGIIVTIVRHREVLAKLGSAAAAISAIRSARQVVLPIWGVSLGLDAQTIALVVGIAGAIDFALFYASGQIMDRRGRLAAVIPAMLLMGIGFIALAFTHDLTGAGYWFLGFAVFIAVGNGLSSGILLTLGADVAPRDNPAPFLGSWRTLTDAGGAAAPLIFSGLAAVIPIAFATGAMGLIGLVGAAGLLRWVPRFTGRR